MEVTEVRIRCVKEENAERLRAFATVTLDREFVIRDVKVIDGHSGLFVAMPSRRLTMRCPHCRTKVPILAKHCSECGRRIEARPVAIADRPVKTHVDIAHPITPGCRQRLHQAVIEAYEQAKDAAPRTDEEEPD